jgi:hypothetical protein
MATMTLAIPDEMKKKMDEFPELNWSEVARQQFAERIKDMEALKLFKKFQEKSTLTEEDALELGRKVNEGLARRYGLVK